MFIRIRRIIFVAIIVFIAYWIYWLIDRNSADELKDDLVDKTQETASTVWSWIKESFDYLFDSEKESLDGNISWTNIIISDPDIIEPVEYTSTWYNQDQSETLDNEDWDKTIGTWSNVSLNTTPITNDKTTTTNDTKTTTTATTIKKTSSSYYNILFQLFK